MSAASKIRRVVADRLGVEVEELTPDVSLVDDLAADSLDVLELGLALEEEFGVSVPEPLMSEIRTYRDLMDAVQTASYATPKGREPSAPVQVSAVVIPPPAHGNGSGLRRAGALTPYTVETIIEDAIRAGRGSRLELSVQSDIDAAELAQLRRRLGRLDRRGVEVRVRRDPQVARPAPFGRPAGIAGAFVGSP